VEYRYLNVVSKVEEFYHILKLNIIYFLYEIYKN